MIPQGITFAKCKLVGSAGSNAIRDYPLETSAICQALLALAEVSVNDLFGTYFWRTIVYFVKLNFLISR